MDITLNSENIAIPEGFAIVQEGTEDIDYEKSLGGVLETFNGLHGIEIPEKLRVMKEGTESLDHKGSFEKLIGSYGELEKRMGSGEAPPKDISGYKLDYSKFPEGNKPTAEGEKKLLTALHASGHNNKQVQAVINEYGAVLTEASTGMPAAKEKIVQEYLTAQHDKAIGELEKSMGKEGLEKNIGFANGVVEKFSEGLTDEEKAGLSKDTGALKLLVNIGKEYMSEDLPPGGEGGEQGEDVKALMENMEGPYWDPKHADHKKTVELVKAHFAKANKK